MGKVSSKGMGLLAGVAGWTILGLAIAFRLLLSGAGVDASTCSTVRHIGWERHPLDCSMYYMCHLGRKMGSSRRCPNRDVWSDSKQRCVGISSKFNDCKCIDRTPFSVCVKFPCTGMFLIEYRSDGKDCSTYHVCYRGVSVNVLSCPEGLRWSSTEGRCSRYSRCRNRGERPPTTSIFTTPQSKRTTKTTTTIQTTLSPTSESTAIATTETPTEPSTHQPTTTTSDAISESELPLLSDCGIIATPYIVGGTPAFEGEWPWQILLKGRINGTHETQCGGVLVNKRWVMTAAHCVFRTALHSTDAWTIVLGEHATTYSSGREKAVRPARIIRHTGYQPRGGFPDDIALMELPEGLYIEKRFITPVCLPPRDFVIPEGSPCWITGWGNTDAQGHGSEVLNSLSVTVWSQKQCQMAWGEHITTQHICVGTGDTGACAGDSGGPLSCEVNGRFVVAGIASWGVPGCRTPGYPDVYTNVTAYISWIRDHVTEEDGALWNPG